MTNPTAIKRSSTPASQLQAPVKTKEKGSTTAQKVDMVLSRNPGAKHAYLFKGFGVKEFSVETPNWFKQSKKGGLAGINSDTRTFFRDLGVESLHHPDSGVRDAAAFLAQSASAQGAQCGNEFNVTLAIRAAVHTLAHPSSGAFAKYQQHQEMARFRADIGVGDKLVEQARHKLISDTVITPFGAYTKAELAPRANGAIEFVRSYKPNSATPASGDKDPLVELDVSESTFTVVDDAEWRKRRDDWRMGNVNTTPEVKAAVTAYVSREYGRENPFEKRSSAGQPVADLLAYIEGGTNKLKGNSVQPLNQFNGITFKSRTEALHYLLWNTPFLNELPPLEANNFMKKYNELANKGL